MLYDVMGRREGGGQGFGLQKEDTPCREKK